MKVALEKDYRRLYTLDDIDRARMVIASMKEDEEAANGYAEYAVAEALRDTEDAPGEVVTASAHTAKNCRIWNAYGSSDESTEDMDVWIEALAKTWLGYIEIGAYLTDIWQSGSVPYVNHMYVKYYKNAPLYD